jgi:hypothetical protein
MLCTSTGNNLSSEQHLYRCTYWFHSFFQRCPFQVGKDSVLFHHYRLIMCAKLHISAPFDCPPRFG